MSGSLTIVGLGPARPEHVTREAADVLLRARDASRRVYGLAHVREVVDAIVPGLNVRSLDYLYQLPGVAETVDTDIYKAGYYSMSKERNPLGIIPKGPVVDFTAPHGREVVGSA